MESLTFTPTNTVYGRVRVAFLTTSYPTFPGDGGGHFVRTSVLAYARANPGHDCHVIAPNLQARRPENNVTEHALTKCAAFEWPGISTRLANPASVIEAVRWLRDAKRTVRAIDPDRIVAHWAIPMGLIALSERARLEIVSHGADVRMLQLLPAPLRNRMVQKFAGRCDSWKFVSLTLADSLKASIDSTTAKLLEATCVIEPCPIEVDDVSRRAAELRKKANAKSFYVAVGRLISSKEIYRCIEHAAEQHQSLVIVGDGPERKRLEGHARRVCANVSFVGNVPRNEALAWIAAADVLLVASRTEGLSTVIREAETLGTAVLNLNQVG